MSKNISATLSHNSDEWATPSKLYNCFMDLGFVDPCPKGSKVDGLQLQFFRERLYINPPFSQLAKWVDWAIEQYYDHDCDIWLLMPSRTDTKYFNKFCDLCPELFFIKGRLHFNDSESCAPFPTLLLHLNVGTHNLYECVDLDGLIIRLKNKYSRLCA